MNIYDLYSRVLVGYPSEYDSLFFRIGGSRSSFTAGANHGGVDFNFIDPTQNIKGLTPVYTPVSGVVVDINLEWGWVVIRSDADGTYHRILHMDSIVPSLARGSSVNAGGVGSVGGLLGTMGGRGKKYDANGNLIYVGPDAFATHVHYDVYLPDADGWGPLDQRIDPIVYWTIGVNPNAPDGASPDNPNPGQRATGLLAYATPVNDYNENGEIDSPDSSAAWSDVGAFIREGQSSFLKVGINTPHTQPITLCIQFAPSPALANLSVAQVYSSSAISAVDDSRLANEGIVYVTLAATENQSYPNTSGLIRLDFNQHVRGQVLHHHIDPITLRLRTAINRFSHAATELRPWPDPYGSNCRAVSIT